jgi:hypothetical protein
MRTVSLVLAIAVICAVLVPWVPALADTGSISRDARGTTTYGDRDPLGGPPTPHVYALSQPLIFGVGLALLGLAALLGIFTFVTARRNPPRP